MRSSIFASFIAVLALAAAPAYAGDLTFTLDSNTGSGIPTSLNPDPDSCLPSNCVLFTGTLANTDNDSVPNDPFYPYMALSSIGAVFSSSPASGALTIDNTFYEDVPGVLSGDSSYAGDGNAPDTYSGSIFGIDIARGTSPGVYTGTVTIDAEGGYDDPDYNGFTVTEDITVDVLAPEPEAGSLALGGLLALALSFGLKRKWDSSEASR